MCHSGGATQTSLLKYSVARLVGVLLVFLVAYGLTWQSSNVTFGPDPGIILSVSLVAIRRIALGAGLTQ